MPSWPEAVPFRYPPSSYSESPDFGVLRSATDFGAKTRRRFLGKRLIRRFTQMMSEAEKDALMAWIETDIAGGALPFTWAVPLGGGATETVKFIVPRNGLQPRQLDKRRFQDRRWSLQIVVEVQP